MDFNKIIEAIKFIATATPKDEYKDGLKLSEKVVLGLLIFLLLPVAAILGLIKSVIICINVFKVPATKAKTSTNTTKPTNTTKK